jgi:hypothetical protein
VYFGTGCVNGSGIVGIMSMLFHKCNCYDKHIHSIFNLYLLTNIWLFIVFKNEMDIVNVKV